MGTYYRVKALTCYRFRRLGLSDSVAGGWVYFHIRTCTAIAHFDTKGEGGFTLQGSALRKGQESDDVWRILH